MSTSNTCIGFLLTHTGHDVRGRFVIDLFAATTTGQPAHIRIDTFRPLFFVAATTPADQTRAAVERKSLPLRAMDGTPVDCLYFATAGARRECAQRLRGEGAAVFESDINPVERFLMERGVTGGLSATGISTVRDGILVMRNPRIRGADVDTSLRVLSLDIETNGDTGKLYSIACSGSTDIVFIIGDSPDTGPITYCSNEHDLLRRFAAFLKQDDPDVLIGWNVENFDLAILMTRCEQLSVPFDLGRSPGATVLPPRDGSTRYRAMIPGRNVLDLPVMLRAYNYTFEHYSLDFVASQLLGKHKQITLEGPAKIAEINRLFREDKESLAKYNLVDAQLTLEIFQRTNILANSMERSKHSGHLLDRVGGSVAAFDYLYLPRLHREGFVAHDVADIPPLDTPLTGGHVMKSRPGIHENVLLLDFKSLYPTIILTFYIDPLAQVAPVVIPEESKDRIQGPEGPEFSRTKAILPGIIRDLLNARAQAKQADNQPLSQAIKILMNSFYGVLGSSGCRFFSPALAQSITGIGRYILKATCTFIEDHTSCPVIYGDTDSLFVLLGPNRESSARETGATIAAEVNTWLSSRLRAEFGADSALELEFETHFRHFFMPTVRGSSDGSKKRYCGVVEKNGNLELLFKGLESARTDWTKLAKEFQQTLYGKVFRKEPVEDYITSVVKQVKHGEVNDKLVYRKQLRKPLSEYTANIPPHARAAKLLDKAPHTIRYCVTLEGPQPVEKLTAPLDHNHYIQCQLKPVADAILEWIGLDFDDIVSGQQDLFTNT